MNETEHVCACGTPFAFRKHHSNDPAKRPHPIEVEPVESGNIAVLPNGTYRVIPKTEAYDGPRYRSHFAYCPNRTDFRKP